MFAPSQARLPFCLAGDKHDHTSVFLGPDENSGNLSKREKGQGVGVFFPHPLVFCIDSKYLRSSSIFPPFFLCLSSCTSVLQGRQLGNTNPLEGLKAGRLGSRKVHFYLNIWGRSSVPGFVRSGCVTLRLDSWLGSPRLGISPLFLHPTFVPLDTPNLGSVRRSLHPVRSFSIWGTTPTVAARSMTEPTRRFFLNRFSL